jgi:hypothetical protein
MRFDDLPVVDSEDWGWVLYATPGGGVEMLWYDDDDIECFCDPDDTEPDVECGCQWLAVCYPSPNLGDACISIDHGRLRALPEGFEIGHARLPSTKGGWIYAVALMPEVDLRRVKIGWTTKPVERRLRSFRTSNPNALLIGLWDAHHHEEERALHLADGRIGNSEVFQCADPWALVARLDAEFRGRPE